MALHFRMKVNGEEIGDVYIQRLHELVHGRPSKYKVEVGYNGSLRRTEVDHLYDDGALVLISKALEAITSRGEEFQREPVKISPKGECEHGVTWESMPYSHWMDHKQDHP